MATDEERLKALQVRIAKKDQLKAAKKQLDAARENLKKLRGKK